MEYCRLSRRMFEFLANVTEKELKNPSFETTHIMLLDSVEQNDKVYDFALVVGWLCEGTDADGEDYYQLFSKIAYQSIDCLMSDYDFDWYMPWYSDNDVCDTEISLVAFTKKEITAMLREADWLAASYIAILEDIEKGDIKLA